MPGFADVANQARQPSILSLDPAVARGLLVRDLNRVGSAKAGSRQREDQERRQSFAASERARTSGQHGFGFLRPGAPVPRYQPAGNQNQGMLDRLMRDAELAAYDRDAPLLRQDLPRARP